MKKLLATLALTIFAASPAAADPPAAELTKEKPLVSNSLAAKPPVEAPKAAAPAAPKVTDILDYASDKWGKPIFTLPKPVQLLPPRQLPIGTAEGKVPDQPIYASTNKYPWFLVSHGDGMLSAVTTFLDDASYDEVFRAIVSKLGRGTMGTLTVGDNNAGQCMYWKQSDHAITMHFTRSVGTVLILTPGEVPYCKAGVTKTAVEQGV